MLSPIQERVLYPAPRSPFTGRDVPAHLSCPYSPECVELDFSHLSQSGWVAHCPSSQREVISSWLHTPLSDGGHKAPSSAPKGATPRFLARFLGSVSCPFGTVSLARSGAHERRRFQPVTASKTFCVLVACTDPQKPLRASKEPKAMRLTVQPNG
jgi:hypothetical protein